MADPTGLGKLAEGVAKLADSQVGIRAYDDLMADAMKEGGQALVDTVKVFRLFTFPIQLLALAQDRLARFCQQVRERVPEERQVEARPSVALPVLMNLRYMEDDNPLTELYLNLLARAIDKERQSEAHPGFVRIIEQMSPDEAMVMYAFKHIGQEHLIIDPTVTPIKQDNSFPFDWLTHPSDTNFYFTHLETLNLIVRQTPSFIQLQEFGKWFIKACIPENFKVERGRDEEDSTQGEEQNG